MSTIEAPGLDLRGMYRDVLRGSDGNVVWDRGWKSNAIVTSCHTLLAGFMAGAPTSTKGIQGLMVGQGLDAWDGPSGAPPATAAQTKLVDPNPFTVPLASLQFTFLTGGTPSAQPTNRLQIVATLGPNLPSWPDGNHASGNLREFGLVAEINGAPTLVNYVTHPVIVKDPSSTLTRTIWLVF
ncbi:hypothetical protein [Sorangium sp. So ce1000]|uniref:hypothetical protein n=1 Tax=Sorangium sp. So ce1000 TaxID=3133325 RepID=UPI003F5DC845